jgi:hypothetical protein
VWRAPTGTPDARPAYYHRARRHSKQKTMPAQPLTMVMMVIVIEVEMRMIVIVMTMIMTMMIVIQIVICEHIETSKNCGYWQTNRDPQKHIKQILRHLRYDHK